MKNLSIIIRTDDAKEMKKYIRLVEPMLGEDSELIIINNKDDEADIPFEHTLYKYTQGYSGFKNFCIASSTGRKIMIIEQGLELTPEFIDTLKVNIHMEDYRNISYSSKIYINQDKSLYFTEEAIIIYNRGIKGFNLNIGKTVDDSGLIIKDKDHIDECIERLLCSSTLNNLYSWYENFILKMPEGYALEFYNMLELKKAGLEKDRIKEIDDIFKNSGRKSKYVDYLNVKSDLHDDRTIDEMKNFNLSLDEKYFSWILKECIDGRKKAADLSGIFNTRQMGAFIEYLIENCSDFDEQLYNFIIYSNKKTDHIKPEEMKVNLAILKAYLENMVEKSDEPGKKKRLIKVLEIYMDCSCCTANKDFKKLQNSSEIYPAFRNVNVKELIRDKGFDEAFRVLNIMSLGCPEISRAIQYYKQKLRFENHNYQHVLSICMIVRNEDKNLERCLKSMEPLIKKDIAELIIVDTGSTDKTIQIAKRYTDKVFSHPWKGNFSESRNYSISLAGGEYIFIMDADEEFTGDEIMKLADEFSKDDFRQFNCFTLKHISYTDYDMTQYTIMSQPRIFINDGSFYYSSSVHNQPIYKYPVKNLCVNILHYGYIVDQDVMERKYIRTASLLKKELEKNPWNIYYRYQLCASYAMHDDIKEALRQVEIYMQRIKEEKDFNEVYLMYYSVAVSIYIGNYCYDKAEAICNEALSIKPDFIDFLFHKAFISFNGERYDDALLYARRYLDTLGSFLNSDVINDGRYSFNTLSFDQDIKRIYIVSNFRLGKYEDCLKKASDLKNDRLLKDCIHEIVASYFYTGRYAELADFFKLRIENDDDLRQVFIYFFLDNLFNSSMEERQKCLASFTIHNIERNFISDINIRLNSGKSHSRSDMLALVEKYNMDELDFESADGIFSKILPVLKELNMTSNMDVITVNQIKKLVQFVLHRTRKYIELKIMTDEEIISLFQKYMYLCSRLIDMKREDLLEARDKYFIANILCAINEIKLKSYNKALEYMHNSVINYNEMEGVVELEKQILIPGYYERIMESNIGCSDEYIKSIEAFKIRINELAGKGLYDEISALFLQYNKVKFHDPSLYSIKASALMLQDRLCEAEECLTEGYYRFFDDIHILNNLNRLYCLKKDYKKYAETLCRSIIIRHDDNIGNNYLTNSNQIQKNTGIKVLHGTMDMTERTVKMVRALKDKGVYARALNYNKKYTGCGSDYIMDVNSAYSGPEIRQMTADAASKLISEFDIFHFYYGTTLTFDHFDLKALKKFDKKVIMQFWGQDVRLYSKAAKFNPYIGDLQSNEEEIRMKLEQLAGYAQYCIVNDYEIYEYVRDYFTDIRIISQMIDVKSFEPCYRDDADDKFTIVHAPTSGRLKGTNYILSAVENIKEKYPWVDFRLVHGIPHDKAVRIYKEADLIIDQLLIGNYGQLSIEAMALGKPVMCWISDFMKERYPRELPVIIANPDDVEDKLEYAIKNKDMLKAIGKKGRLYAEKYHDIRCGIDKFIDLYKEK